jgi:hypothetical protein
MIQRIAIVVVVLLLVEPALAEPEKGAARDPQTIRAKYAKQPCKKLSISEPVEVTETLYYKDGGSIGLVLMDSKKVQHKFAWDGREGKPRSIFVGVDYPNEKTGRRLGSLEEEELYGVLIRWVNRHPKRDAFFDEKKEINDEKRPSLWEFRRFFLNLDERFTK